MNRLLWGSIGGKHEGREMFKANNYLITIVELQSFQADADRIFSDDERDDLADFISASPDSGLIIPGTGGD